VVLFVLRVRVLRSMLILTGGVLAILASEWAIGQTIQLPFVAQISGTTAGGLLICALLEHDARHEFLSQARIYRLATIDMLSQALNRYAFFERGMLEIARTRRNQSNLALLMIDIDHFKQVNDSYGHLIGDQVIARLATICRSHIRTNDLLGRIGGEEFAILLSETDAAAAAQVGERLRMLVAANTLPLAPNPVRFTISIGVAMLEDRAWSLQDLIAHADACLYVAKRTGRNRLIERLPSEPPKLLARALGNPSLTHSD
jgi:diguanylate cyclase (GGDEF)-like protein